MSEAELEDNDQPDQDELEGADYSNFAAYYDLEYQKVMLDLDFYREIARRVGATGRILELACGAGRVSIPLAEAGFNVTGLDVSEEMLAIARRKVTPNMKARFVQGDMRDLGAALGEEKFDLIFVALNSFQHLLTQADQLACLRSARHHLAPVGLFVVDIMNPEEKEQYPADGRMELSRITYNPANHSTLYSFLSTVATPSVQRRDYCYFFDETFRDGTIKRTVARLTLRYTYRYEMQLLLERAGFRVEELYGSHDFEEFGEGSHKLIYICRRG